MLLDIPLFQVIVMYIFVSEKNDGQGHLVTWLDEAFQNARSRIQLPCRTSQFLVTKWWQYDKYRQIGSIDCTTHYMNTN
jgi:hypothetical protein